MHLRKLANLMSFGLQDKSSRQSGETKNMLSIFVLRTKQVTG